MYDVIRNKNVTVDFLSTNDAPRHPQNVSDRGTVRLGFPQPESTNYALSVFNEPASEKFYQGPPLKFNFASFGGIIQNRK